MITSSSQLLFRVLQAPQQMAALDLGDWDVLLRWAQAAGVLAHLAEQVENLGLDDDVPREVRPHLKSAAMRADRQRRGVFWEVSQIERALAEVDTPLVLLKGAAYLLAGIPTAKGRLYSDVDILVAKDRMPEVEAALKSANWVVADLSEAHQKYFRTWLHELPPLVHRRRRTTLDVHHTILPQTDRLQLDAGLLTAAAQPLAGRRSRVLAPADMVLHSAAHLFRNGDFRHGVRDLADLDGMLRQFGEAEDFWAALIDRAQQLDLTIPCFCGLRYAKRYFDSPIPPAIEQQVAKWRPAIPNVALVDRLVARALMPEQFDRPDRRRALAISLLSYWPLPRLRAMATSLFWTKRLPKSLGGG